MGHIGQTTKYSATLPRIGRAIRQKTVWCSAARDFQAIQISEAPHSRLQTAKALEILVEQADRAQNAARYQDMITV